MRGLCSGGCLSFFLPVLLLFVAWQGYRGQRAEKLAVGEISIGDNCLAMLPHSSTCTGPLLWPCLYRLAAKMALMGNQTQPGLKCFQPPLSSTGVQGECQEWTSSGSLL